MRLMADGPKTPMPARRKARKRALDVLYEADLRDVPIARDARRATSRGWSTPRPEHLRYAIDARRGRAAHLDRIDELIASYAEGWTLDRMPVVDRNLARIAVYELLYVDEIDDPVAISEAVELAKRAVDRRLAALPQRPARPDRRVRHPLNGVAQRRRRWKGPLPDGRALARR